VATLHRLPLQLRPMQKIANRRRAVVREQRETSVREMSFSSISRKSVRLHANRLGTPLVETTSAEKRIRFDRSR
jgi:hypothetical protein